MICILDYGVGNLASIKNMLKRIGVESIISSSIEDVQSASKLILPGVGAFDTCAKELRLSGLQDALNKKVMVEGVPVLGVCVGMQLLFDGSDEGQLPGLSWIQGHCRKLDLSKMPQTYKVPHMGWTDVCVKKKSKLLSGLESDSRFYFVHSYYGVPSNEKDVLLTAEYGYNIAVGVEKNNILGVQFHPEKSHKFGMKLLTNFSSNF